MIKFKENLKLIDRYITFGLLLKVYIYLKRWNYFFLYIKKFSFIKKFNNRNLVFYNYKYNYLSELSDKYSSDKGTLKKDFKKKVYGAGISTLIRIIIQIYMTIVVIKSI